MDWKHGPLVIEPDTDARGFGLLIAAGKTTIRVWASPKGRNVLATMWVEESPPGIPDNGGLTSDGHSVSVSSFRHGDYR